MTQIVDVKQIAIDANRRPAYNAVMVRWLMHEAEMHRSCGRTATLFCIVRNRPDGTQRQLVQLVASE